jgi:hypothetical protein
LLIVALLGHPLIFGAYLSFAGLSTPGGVRFLPSLLGELIALGVATATLYQALVWLRAQRFVAPLPIEDYVVHGVSLVYLLMIAITVANSSSFGLLASGSRLEFYFANDWYRRLVTFSYVPSMVATYHALKGLLSPTSPRRRLGLVVNLFLLFAMSVLSGSKGAAILMVLTALGFVYSVNRMPVIRIAAMMGAAAVLYMFVFLYFTTDRSITLLGIAYRFYLSIDMSLLLQERGTSEVLASKLNGVWTEIFRNVNGFSGRISASPIGALIYEYVSGVPAQTGANCRFGSLLILYPDRLDFLLGFPLLAVGSAFLVRQIMAAFGLRQAAMVGACCFLFQSFQDVYWWASHVAPLILCFGLVLLARAITNASLRHSSDTA